MVKSHILATALPALVLLPQRRSGVVAAWCVPDGFLHQTVGIRP